MDKYLVIEHHKYTSFKDDWTIKFASVDQDTALEKLVALNTLNDNKDKIYYIVDMKLIIKFIIKGHTKISSFGGRARGNARYIYRKVIFDFVLL